MYRGFKRYSVGTSLPQGWIAIQHGLFIRSRPECASVMCTGKNRHFALQEAKAQAKTNSEGRGGVAAPRLAAANALHKIGGSFAKTGIMHSHLPVKSPQVHSDAAGPESLRSDDQLQAVQLIKMQLDEAIYTERMNLQQRFSDAAAAGRVRLQHPTTSRLQRDFSQGSINTTTTPLDISRLLALHQQAYQTRRASGLLSSGTAAPRLNDYARLLLEQQAQRRASFISSVPQLHGHDSLLGSQVHRLEDHRLLVLQDQLSARETQLRQQLQQKEALLLNKQSRGSNSSSPAAVSFLGHQEEVNRNAGRPVITEAERQRLLRLRAQLDYVIGM